VHRPPCAVPACFLAVNLAGGRAIDPGGPVDPTVAPQPVDDVDRPAAFTLMAPGWYPPLEAITQSYEQTQEKT
jgi:hypothetical protein